MTTKKKTATKKPDIRIVILLLLGFPRLIALALGLRRLADLILIFLFFCTIDLRRHIAPPPNVAPLFVGSSHAIVEVAIAIPRGNSRLHPLAARPSRDMHLCEDVSPPHAFSSD